MATGGDNVRVSAMLLPGLAADFRAAYEAEGMTLSEAIRAAVRDWVRARKPVVTVRPG